MQLKVFFYQREKNYRNHEEQEDEEKKEKLALEKDQHREKNKKGMGNRKKNDTTENIVFKNR